MLKCRPTIATEFILFLLMDHFYLFFFLSKKQLHVVLLDTMCNCYMSAFKRAFTLCLTFFLRVAYRFRRLVVPRVNLRTYIITSN